MTASTIFGYVVLSGSGCVLARWLWFSFTAYLDGQATEAFADRREQSRQQVADTDDMACAFGDVAAYPPNARCPVDFDEGKLGTESDRAGERAKSGTELRGIQKHSHFSPDIARPEPPL